MTTLPYSEEAESYVLGSMMWRRKAVGEALEILHADDFVAPKHRILFRTLQNMYLEGEDIDPILVAERLRRDGQDGQVARDYIIKLLDEAGSNLYLKSHARLVLHRSHARALGRVVQEPHTLSDEQIEEATEKADDLLRRLRLQDQEPTKLVGSWVAGDLEDIEAAGRDGTPTIGIESGFPRLDEKTNGWSEGQLVVVGAQTGMGKTSLMLRFALEAAKKGTRVLFFSLEMTAREIRERIYAQEAKVPLTAIRRGSVDEHWKALSEVAEKVRRLPLLLSGRRGMSAKDITAEVRRRTSEEPIGMVVVDYLQLVKTDASKQRYEQVGEIARSLKVLAGELRCVVITGAQLSRRVEERPDKRPLKSDLRESGDIEHTADIILLLHWPWKADRSGADPNHVELLIAKNRQGEAGKGINIRYAAETTFHYEAGA